MKHWVSVYSTKTGQLLKDMTRCFDNKQDADAYKAQVEQQYAGKGLTVL